MFLYEVISEVKSMYLYVYLCGCELFRYICKYQSLRLVYNDKQ